MPTAMNVSHLMKPSMMALHHLQRTPGEQCETLIQEFHQGFVTLALTWDGAQAGIC